jgi:UDP-N-acetyl-D-galactosamine dehydrogenase
MYTRSRENFGRAGRDFSVGYSPERINQAIRIIAAKPYGSGGRSGRGPQIVAAVYGSVVPAGFTKPPRSNCGNAKVIENAQRDLNIAFMNEFDCHALHIDTTDVLAAGELNGISAIHAGSIGGHCIGVDPYYLTHRAESRLSSGNYLSRTTPQ